MSCDLKGCITGRSSHVDLSVDEQCAHHRPLGQATPQRDPSHICFVGHGVKRDQTGYLSVAPKMHYAARPAECSSTEQYVLNKLTTTSSTPKPILL